MAIEKNNFKASRFDQEFSVGSRSKESMSSDDNELHRQSSMDSEDDDEFDDADSGAGSDDFDLLELGETGSEFCQVGDQTCSIPFELYDLPDLRDILSLDVWNECLTEEERFALTKYLPDMDQETFMQNLKELFEGKNFHFGSPVTKLFEMLKGGLCEPRVALYREGLNFFQRHQHYHLLRKHQDSLVSSLLQIREAWQNCKGYSIQEKLRVLNIKRSETCLMGEKKEDMETDSSEKEESREDLWGKRLKGRNFLGKARRDWAYGTDSSVDFLSQGLSAAVDPSNGKQNPKGLLKLVGSKTPSQKELAASFHSRQQGNHSLRLGPYGSAPFLPREGKTAAYGSRVGQRIREPTVGEDDEEEIMYGIACRRDRDVSRGSATDHGRCVKLGKKREVLRGDEYASNSYMGLPLSSKNEFPVRGGNLNVNQLSDIKVLTARPSNKKTSYAHAGKAKFLEPSYDDQIGFVKGCASQLSSRSNHDGFSDGAQAYWSEKKYGDIELSDAAEPYRRKKAQLDVYVPDPSFDYEYEDIRTQKSMMGREFPDARIRALRESQFQMDDRLFHLDKRAKLSDKIRGATVQNGQGRRMFHGGEDTESDSSDQLDGSNPFLMSKMAFPNALLEGGRSSLAGSGFDRKRDKSKKNRKASARSPDGTPHTSTASGEICGQAELSDIETHSSKSMRKGKMQRADRLQTSASRVVEDGLFNGLGNLNVASERKSSRKIRKTAQMEGDLTGDIPLFMLKTEKRHKGTISRQTNHLEDYLAEKGCKVFEAGQSAPSAQDIEENMKDNHERSESSLLACTSAVKKRKGKQGLKNMAGQEGSDYLQSMFSQQVDGSTSLKKRVKKKVEADSRLLDGGTSEQPVTDLAMTEVEMEIKPQKKPFTLITPTIHTGFSFSVVHLLSAVRMAMITPNQEDSLEVRKHLENIDGRQNAPEGEDRKHECVDGSQGDVGVNKPEHQERMNVPFLTVQDIVTRVRSNPGDPCILETPEPLQDLVRGVLKILSSKTAPLGAKGWKPLVQYEKSTKSWSWIGPVPQSASDHETMEEVTSPEAWDVTHKVLVKLVDAFANWLKSGQETLQQIGSLPAPPLELMQANLDEKERFKDLRAQKSLTTISPSPEEVRAYFRMEEQLRYSFPDRAFSYTAADGKKSIVAPLRKGGGKPTSKARDHFMLKRDRPPHVTILCLVRDAAARLPGSIGTRADVCTLIRDSQYIVEDVSDAQVNQVVSGALDRLHYERDPCVQFDGERKLWVYLHREREEEDFEDDGTSSTKKWKRQKKDATEQDEQGAITVACHGTGDQTGFDLSSDLNYEPTCANDDTRAEVMYDDTRQRTEDNAQASQVPEQDAIHQSHTSLWQTLGLDPSQENKLLCQENSRNEDFEHDTFNR